MGIGARWRNISSKISLSGQKKERVSDKFLIEVVAEMSRGLLGDRLGANIYKKRIKVDGRGKRGGGRVVVLFKDCRVPRKGNR